MTAVSGLAFLAVLAGCQKELILPGQRFDVRAPLEASLPTEAQPDPVDTTRDVVNLSQPIALPGAVANAEWTHRAGGVSHLSQHGALSAAPVRVWSVNIGAGNSRRASISAAPVVAGGRVFTLDSATRVAATTTGGALAWAVDLTPETDRSAGVSGGGLAASGGRVFATTGYGELVALDAGSGAVVWRQKLDAAVTGAPTVEAGTVYVVGRDSSAWALDAASGKVLWQFPGTPAVLGVIGAAGPALAGANVLLPFGSGEVVAAEKATGVRLWKAIVGGERLGRGYGSNADVTGDPVVAGGLTYIGIAGGRTVAVETATGKQVWTSGNGAMAPVLAVGGSVFLVNDENRLMRLDGATGTTIWSVDLPYYQATKAKKRRAITAQYGPVLAGGRLVVAGGDGVLRLFSPTDGAALGGVDLPGGAAAQPALAGGMLFVVSGNGQLHAFR